MLRPVYDESQKPMSPRECDRVNGFRPDYWKKGDALIGRTLGGGGFIRLKFLAWSELDGNCFIAEDDDGGISDDWMWREFWLENGEDDE